MYCINDEQIEYILNDIRRNGVDMEDLQLNLLDHICCIIEQELEEDDDFEQFYSRTIKRFYKHNMREIEDETINLLTFKNYYAMKKIMIFSGVFSAGAFIVGSLFKIAHWPGANILITLGIGIFSLLFLPLLGILRAQEVPTNRDKFVLLIAASIGIVFSMATLFTLMHWPGSSILWLTSISLSAFVLLPVYFFTGIRKPEAKLNTILMSVMLVGFTGLQFSLINLRPSDAQKNIRVNTYLQNEEILDNLSRAVSQAKDAAEINMLCEQIKKVALDGTFTDPEGQMKEGKPAEEFFHGGPGVQLIVNLREKAIRYNAAHGRDILPMHNSLLDAPIERIGNDYSNIALLTSITQLQMYVLSAENNKVAANN